MTAPRTPVPGVTAQFATDDVDPHYRRNFTAGLVHGVFFQAAAAFGSIYTVLPSFVALLTASPLAVGLMAAIQDAGEIVPQLFTAYWVEPRPRKKPILVGVVLIRLISWMLLAWLTFQLGASRPEIVLAVLLIFFSLFSIAGGVGAVVYADIFAKAIPAARRGRFTGWKQLLGYAAAIGAGYVVKLILDDSSGLPFPTNYALIFAFSALLFSVALFGVSLIKEPVQPVRRNAASFPDLLRRSLVIVRANANFRTLVGVRALTMAGLALAPFYVVYAQRNLGMDPGMIGIYLSAQMAGAAASNLLWGWLGDRYGNKPVVVGTALAGGLASLLAQLTPAGAPQLFTLVFVLLGAAMSGLRLGHPNLLLEMAPAHIRPTCVALQNTLVAPVVLLPLAVGVAVQFVSYQVLLTAGVAVMALAMLLALRLRDPRRNPEGACFD